MRNKYNRNGFTIVELIIVIAIAAVMSSAALYFYNAYRSDVTVKAESQALIDAVYDIRDVFSIAQNYNREGLEKELARSFPITMINSNGEVVSRLTRKTNTLPIKISATDYPISSFNSKSEGRAMVIEYPNVNPEYCIGFVKSVSSSFDYIGSRYGGLLKTPSQPLDISGLTSICGGKDEFGQRYPDLFFATQ